MKNGRYNLSLNYVVRFFNFTYMKGTFPINKFRELETPFYYYDANLLRDTLNVIRTEAPNTISFACIMQ